MYCEKQSFINTDFCHWILSKSFLSFFLYTTSFQMVKFRPIYQAIGATCSSFQQESNHWHRTTSVWTRCKVYYYFKKPDFAVVKIIYFLWPLYITYFYQVFLKGLFYQVQIIFFRTELWCLIWSIRPSLPSFFCLFFFVRYQNQMVHKICSSCIYKSCLVFYYFLFLIPLSNNTSIDLVHLLGYDHIRNITYMFCLF